MKAILEFNLPEDREEYELCFKASDYLCAIQEIVEYLRNTIKYNSDGTGIRSINDAFEKTYKRAFDICNEHGFSPWED